MRLQNISSPAVYPSGPHPQARPKDAGRIQEAGYGDAARPREPGLVRAIQTPWGGDCHAEPNLGHCRERDLGLFSPFASAGRDRDHGVHSRDLRDADRPRERASTGSTARDRPAPTVGPPKLLGRTNAHPEKIGPTRQGEVLTSTWWLRRFETLKCRQAIHRIGRPRPSRAFSWMTSILTRAALSRRAEPLRRNSLASRQASSRSRQNSRLLSRARSSRVAKHPL